MRPKVGLMSFISPQEGWPEDQLQEARAMLKEARLALEAQGVDVLDPGEITRTHQTAYSQARELRARGAESLILYCGFWLFSSAVVAAADAAQVPVIVWTNPRKDTAGYVGAAIARGSLDILGHNVELVVGEFDDQHVLRKLMAFVRAASTVYRLRGMTYGMIGGRSLGMYTGMIDEVEWRKKFGIEVETAEQIEVLSRAESVPDSEAKKSLSWMRGYFGGVEVDEEVMLRSIRVHLAVKQMIKEYGFDFAGVKCLPEFPKRYASYCVAHSLINDGLDMYGEGEGTVLCCEVDSNGGLSMQILHLLTSQPGLFADVRHLDPETLELTICNCGSQPTKFAKSPKEVTWLPQIPINGPGAASHYVCRPGEATLMRLSRINGAYHMLIYTGTAHDAPLEKMKETGGLGWVWPHGFFTVDTTYEKWLGNLRSNHIHFAYGNWVEELLQVCKLLDIVPIVI